MRQTILLFIKKWEKTRQVEIQFAVLSAFKLGALQISSQTSTIVLCSACYLASTC